MTESGRSKNCCVVILAAGLGTRMQSRRAKVLHPVCGRPMIHYAVETALALAPEKIIVVIGHEADQVRAALAGFPVEFALQPEQRGTGHAAMQMLPALEGFSGSVVIYYGDTPLIAREELALALAERELKDADLALLTVRLASPSGYGRVLRSGGEIARVVEESDATAEEKEVHEVNPGIYCFKAAALRQALSRLEDHNLQREYYLTDAVELLRRGGGRVVGVLSDQTENLLGINTRADLALAERQIWRRRARQWMLAGVTLLNPDTFFVSHQTQIGRDTVIYPNVVLEGTTEIGEGVTIFPGARIADSRIGAHARILDHCVISESAVGAGTTVGPFAHLRAHADVGAECRVGNFVEVKNSRIGDRTKSAHLTYLGDAEIGKDVNIGAGTITCNYDGFGKNPTSIGDGAFIGSGSQLVAPVRVGEGAYVAAGSSITEDVPAKALGIARGRQENKEGWVEKKRGARKREDSEKS
ncbi:MAG: bifunctional UDP-N-acetylglucosamine diphosphorylase/glucosamine-1-phosphate N-acetyltransferase GlmU [Acidobacteria bacterium]|nr:bifunctional UDP-N-acetylglucosamine diphosphorylase/glucosamine-1-phosphate N-acetyltransferase GlmU [Acidobacteriota bacterium]